MKNRSVVMFMMAVAAVMLFFNYVTPPTLSDDVLYKCVWTLDETEARRPIETFGDVMESQAAHRQVVNGRMVVHTVAQVFMGMVGKDVFNVLNAFMFCLLVLLCALWVRPVQDGKDVRAMVVDGAHGLFLPVVLFTFLFFILVPGFHDAFLWFVGSFNYLWTMVAVVAFLIYFYKKKDAALTAGSFLAGPFALLAGWTHEGLTLPLSLGLMVWMFLCRRDALRSGAFPAVLCFMAGTALCVLASGTLERVESSGMSLMSRMFYGCYCIFRFVRVSWLLLAVVAVAWFRHRRDVLKDELRRHIVLYSALLPAFGIILVCGRTQARVCTHAEILVSLLLVSLLLRLKPDRSFRTVVVAACVVMTAVTVSVAGFGVTNKHNYDYQLAQQQNPAVDVVKVRQMSDTGCALFDALVERYVVPSVEFGFFSCYQGFDADDVNLRSAAMLYGKRRVIYLPEEFAVRLQDMPQTFKGVMSDACGKIWVVCLPDGSRAKALRFLLHPEPPESLPLYKRPFAYEGDCYELPELKFKTVELYGRTYLFFARPLTNVYRRIKSIDVVLDSGERLNLDNL